MSKYNFKGVTIYFFNLTFFCDLFQFSIYSVKVYNNVQVSKWYGTTCQDIDASPTQSPQQRGTPKGFLYCIDNVQYSKEEYMERSSGVWKYVDSSPQGTYFDFWNDQIQESNNVINSQNIAHGMGVSYVNWWRNLISASALL